jgi:hypothetical protein
VNVLVKLATVARVLEAAMVLEAHGLLDGRTAQSVVRQYVEANPDINAALSAQQPTQPAEGE